MATDISNLLASFGTDPSKLLEGLSNPSELVGGLVDTAKGALGASPIPSPFPSATSAPGEMVKGSLTNVVNLNNIQYVIISFLIVWAAVLIGIRFSSLDTETKDNVKYMHEVLMGGIGMIPAILLVVTLVIVVTTVIPAIVTVTPSLSTFLNNASGMIGTAVKSIAKK